MAVLLLLACVKTLFMRKFIEVEVLQSRDIPLPHVVAIVIISGGVGAVQGLISGTPCLIRARQGVILSRDRYHP